MIKPIFLIISLLLCSLSADELLARQLIQIDLDEVVICPVSEKLGEENTDPPPSFNEKDCHKVPATEINPQNNALWVKATINIPSHMRDDEQPYSIYVSGKSSSRVYFNGKYLGQNGTPSQQAKDEFPGKIDAMFYVPNSLIKESDNQILLKLSSHHGFLTLGSPINFIGFGSYADPSYFIQRNLGVSIIPLGALILGALYFLVVSFSPQQRQTNLLFLLMTSLAAGQLFAEISRALYSYSYPLHDVRLLLIVSLSFGFGICLFNYMTIKLEIKKRLSWSLFTFSFAMLAVILMPGFDGKTAVAILVPSFICSLLVTVQMIKQRTKEFVLYSIVFWAFTITIIITLTSFHNLLFYYIITGVLGFLFIQQALKLNREQKERLAEQAQIAKLQFKLDQNQQKLEPRNIKINSAGKIEFIASNQIAFCKAAGDYVELNLKGKKQVLFSGNLKELENQLPNTFLRVHRSYLVNMDFISSLNKNSMNNQTTSVGGGFLLLEGDFEVPVSRRIMPMVRNVINKG